MARARYLACPLGELVARDIESTGDKSRQVGPYDLVPYLSDLTILMDYDHHLALPVLNIDQVPYYPPTTTLPWYITICVRYVVLLSLICARPPRPRSSLSCIDNHHLAAMAVC
jgi:hypothetical protein